MTVPTAFPLEGHSGSHDLIYADVFPRPDGLPGRVDISVTRDGSFDGEERAHLPVISDLPEARFTGDGAPSGTTDAQVFLTNDDDEATDWTNIMDVGGGAYVQARWARAQQTLDEPYQIQFRLSPGAYSGLEVTLPATFPFATSWHVREAVPAGVVWHPMTNLNGAVAAVDGDEMLVVFHNDGTNNRVLAAIHNASRELQLNDNNGVTRGAENFSTLEVNTSGVVELRGYEHDSYTAHAAALQEVDQAAVKWVYGLARQTEVNDGNWKLGSEAEPQGMHVTGDLIVDGDVTGIPAGPEGRFPVRVYYETAHGGAAPSVPTGITASYDDSTHAFALADLPTGWSATAPSAFDRTTHDLYVSEAAYVPATDTLSAFGTPFKDDADTGATGPAGPAGPPGDKGDDGADATVSDDDLDTENPDNESTTEAASRRAVARAVADGGGGSTPTQNDPEHIRAAWFGGGDPREGEPYSVPVAKVFAGGGTGTPALSEVASSGAFPSGVSFNATANRFELFPPSAGQAASIRVQWEDSEVDFTAVKMKADFGRTSEVNHQDSHFYFGASHDPTARLRSLGFSAATTGLIVFVYGGSGVVQIVRMDDGRFLNASGEWQDTLAGATSGSGGVGEDEEWECVYFKGRLIVRRNGVAELDVYLPADDLPALTGAKFGFLATANSQSGGTSGATNTIRFNGVSIEDVTSDDIDPHSHADSGGTAPATWAESGNADVIPAAKLPPQDFVVVADGAERSALTPSQVRNGARVYQISGREVWRAKVNNEDVSFDPILTGWGVPITSDAKTVREGEVAILTGDGKAYLALATTTGVTTSTDFTVSGWLPIGETIHLSGQGDPESSLGGDNNFYLDTDTDRLFYKSKGTWKQVGGGQATLTLLGLVRRATTNEAELGEDDVKYMTPAKTKSLVEALATGLPAGFVSYTAADSSTWTVAGNGQGASPDSKWTAMTAAQQANYRLLLDIHENQNGSWVHGPTVAEMNAMRGSNTTVALGFRIPGPNVAGGTMTLTFTGNQVTSVSWAGSSGGLLRDVRFIRQPGIYYEPTS